MPALGLALAVAIIARALAGGLGRSSSATANGIAVFMVFGAGPGRRAARPDRRGARLRHARRTSPTSRAGCCRSRRSTRPALARADRRHGRLHAAGDRPRPVRGRARGRRRACGCGRSCTWASSGRGLCEASPGATSETPVRPGRRLHRRPVPRQPGRGRARRRRPRRPRRCSASRSWTNLSETTFVLPPEDAGRRLPRPHLHAGRRAAVRRPPDARHLPRLARGPRPRRRTTVRPGVRRRPRHRPPHAARASPSPRRRCPHRPGRGGS